MNYSPLFSKIVKAKNNGFRIISCVGGGRSGKTISNLQMMDFMLSNSKSTKVGTTAGMTLANLTAGPVYDYERIVLEGQNVNISDIKRKSPYSYKRYKSHLLFYAFDKPEKALSVPRNFLHCVEWNFIPFETINNLFIRSTELILGDYNPSTEFWVDTEGFRDRSDFIELHTTFLDNIQFLSKSQIDDFRFAKKKSEEEYKSGKLGYWANYWKVYGLGLKGDIEGIVYTNWKGCTLEQYKSIESPEFVGVDWGFNDPLAIVGVKFCFKTNKFYFHEYLYKSGIGINDYDNILRSLGFVPVQVNHVLSNDKSKEKTYLRTSKDSTIFICDSAEPSKIDYLRNFGYNAFAVSKPNILERVQFLQACECFYTENSMNLQRERSNYSCDKFGKFTGSDHALDAANYSAWTMRSAYTINPLKF